MGRKNGFNYESYVSEIIEEMDENKEKFLHTIGRAIKYSARHKVRKLTGEGEKSIDYIIEPKKSRVIIGSTLWRLIFLEWGTRKIKAKRFLRPAAMGLTSQIRKDAADIVKFRSKNRKKWGGKK